MSNPAASVCVCVFRENRAELCFSTETQIGRKLLAVVRGTVCALMAIVFQNNSYK